MKLDTLLERENLLPFLPMIYVAWADGELSDDEISAIRHLAQAQSVLGDKDRDVLTGWLDPSSPPTTMEMSRLLHDIRRSASALPKEKRMGLAQVGLEIAQTDGEDHEAVRQALTELEGALGVMGSEVTAQILDAHPPTLPVTTWEEMEPAAAFDVEAMQRLLDGDDRETIEKMRALLSDPRFSYDYESSKDEFREKVYTWLQIIADEGIGELAYPVVTGAAQDMGPFLSAFETLAFFDISLVIKFGVQFGLFGGSIYFLGTEKHHDLLKKAATCELPGCFAMTELGHGSNVRDLGTTAVYDSETQEWIIHTPDEMSRKEWIGNAAVHGRMATVFAQLEVDGIRHGVHAFLVPIRDEEGETLPNVFIEDCGHKLGLNGVDNGRLWFDHVRVPRWHLLDKYAQVSKEGEYSSPINSEGKRFFTMIGTLVGGRVSIAAAALSVAKSALTIAIRYGAMRRQFGPSGEPESPILDFRTHQRRLMPLLANAYGLDFAIDHLGKSYLDRNSINEREVEALAAGLKAWSSWNTTETVQVARECCGGQGYLTVNRFASLKADTDIFTTFEGDNTVLMQLVAKSMLSEYGQQFQDLNFFSSLRFLAKQARAQLTELDPVTSRRTDPEHLRNAAWQLEMYRHREEMLLSSVARRFKRRTDEGMNSFDAMIEVQDHLMATAFANVERIVLEQFIVGVDRATDPDVRRHLEMMRQLFGLWHLNEDLSWFMENSLVEPAKARAIRDEINTLCLEVREQAVHLVDAFGIPDSCLSAPIAFSPLVEPKNFTQQG